LGLLFMIAVVLTVGLYTDCVSEEKANLLEFKNKC
jgi:hypothetical protein